MNDPKETSKQNKQELKSRELNKSTNKDNKKKRSNNGLIKELIQVWINQQLSPYIFIKCNKIEDIRVEQGTGDDSNENITTMITL